MRGESMLDVPRFEKPTFPFVFIVGSYEFFSRKCVCAPRKERFVSHHHDGKEEGWESPLKGVVLRQYVCAWIVVGVIQHVIYVLNGLHERL